MASKSVVMQIAGHLNLASLSLSNLDASKQRYLESQQSHSCFKYPLEGKLYPVASTQLNRNLHNLTFNAQGRQTVQGCRSEITVIIRVDYSTYTGETSRCLHSKL